MTTSIKITIPPSIEKYAVYLADFVDGMVKKLDKNSHKDTPTRENLQTIMDLLIEEISEFEMQVAEDRFSENSLIELMDQANFAFLAYIALRAEHEAQIRDDKT